MGGKRKKRSGSRRKVLVARVGDDPGRHETRRRAGRTYTELHLVGRLLKREEGEIDEVGNGRDGDDGDDAFEPDDLGRFLARADETETLDKYLDRFYASDLAKSHVRVGEPGGLARTIRFAGVARSLSIGSTIVNATPTPRTPSPLVPPPPPPPAATYSNGEKTWRGLARDVAEIECAIVVDYVTRVKRLPPFVPRVLGHDARWSKDERPPSHVEYSLRTEHVGAGSGDPTLAGFIETAKKYAAPPAGFERRLDGVFVQILLALSGLQRHCGFLHNDLHTKNVLLRSREGTGPLVVHDVSGRAYVFEDDVPLVKLIDFGHAEVRHPETGRVSSARWMSPLFGFTNGADLRRLAIVLAKHLSGCNSSLVSEDLRADLAAIVDPTSAVADDDRADSGSGSGSGSGGGAAKTLDAIVESATDNINVEMFGFPLVGFATPTTLLETGRVARRFVLDRGNHHYAPPKNIFHELPDDGWSSTRPFSWFSRRERGGGEGGDYAPCRPLLRVTPPELVELRDHASSALRRRLDDRPRFDTDSKRFDFEAIVVYGPTADTRTRRRVAWTGLVLFQRAVVFYLRTFVPLEDARMGRVDLRRRRDTDEDGDPELERLVTRCVNESLEFAKDTAAGREKRLLLRLCLIAACGGHGQFFNIAPPERNKTSEEEELEHRRRWWRAVAKVREGYDAMFDAGWIVAPAETIVRGVEGVKTCAYADETRGNGRGPTIERLFEWSGDCASSYSFGSKQIEDLVATS